MRSDLGSRAEAARLAAVAAATVALMAGCASGLNRAPVEERRPVPRPPAAIAATAAEAPVAEAPRSVPAAESAAKPGHYTVKPGDVLVRIALEHGQNWRDLQRWNSLENPNLIEVGQVLRVVPPGPAEAVMASARAVPPAGRVESRPLEGRAGPLAAAVPAPPSAPTSSAGPNPNASPSPTAPTVSAAMAASAPVAPAASAASATGPKARPPREGDDDIAWQWPAAGPVATAFDEGRNKGVAITGRAGEPVFAAADGRVVYAGSGLRGYGNLVIVKHNASFLTAYAHNQSLLVKDEQVVRKGQKIAEMGSSDADRVQLHFEVRRLGVPIDPMRVLPQR